MPARSRWTEVEARAALSAWRASGLTLAAFARKRGLVAERLYRWRKKFGDLAEDEADVEFLPVRVEERQRRGEPVLVMLRSGHMLKVGRGFDEEAFSRVIVVLEQC